MRTLLVILLATLGLGAAENLLTNGDFEAGTSGWSNNGGELSVVKDRAVSGQALKISMKAPGERNISQKLSTPIAGQTLTISGKAFLDEANDWKPTLIYMFTQNAEFQKIDWKVLKMVQQADDWNSFSVDAAIPNEAVHVTIGVFAKDSAGTIWLDDLSVTAK
ncbi:MAG: hypothetical protein PF961_14570 [Planctomycetota bacterium]|jgi:hypothetical protein|nr:hypothetical protein [Planctomycetota bacterium]